MRTTYVKIVSAATAWDDPKMGETIILVFHEALCFGDPSNAMENSLINPNQCCLFGVSICDDPFDKHRLLGIYDPVSKTTLPFQMFGSTAGDTTCSPKLWEYESCRRIIMCNNAPWDPNDIKLPYANAANSQKSGCDKSSLIVPSRQRIDTYEEPQIMSMGIDLCPHIFASQCVALILTYRSMQLQLHKDTPRLLQRNYLESGALDQSQRRIHSNVRHNSQSETHIDL
jgi:hypothetical protein